MRDPGGEGTRRGGGDGTGDRFVPSEVPSRRHKSDPLGLLGTALFQYDVEEFLGGGGMGVVYRAHDRRLDRTVALKFLPAFVSHRDEARARFFVEARAASKLDHPNICTVHEIGETEDGKIFIAMSYYSGETLKQKLARGRVPVAEAVDIAIQIGRGLACAHAARVIHRDIKPANVMVLDDGTVKILDFGTAKVEDLELTQTGKLVGTVKYMSPEQVDGLEIDHRTDIWSLGALMYEMFSGRAPFGGTTPQAILSAASSQTPVPLRSVVEDLPAEIDAVVRRCLQKDRARRFTAAEELVDTLTEAASAHGLWQWDTTGGTRRHVTPVRRKRRVPRAGLVSAVVASAVIGAFAAARALLSPGGPEAVVDRTYVAVLPFTTDDPADEVLAAGLTHSLTGLAGRLAESSDALWVVPASEIRTREVTTAARARGLFPINAVLVGHLQRLGGTLEVALELVDPDPEAIRVLASAVLPGPAASSFQDEAREALARMLGTSAGSAASGPNEGVAMAGAYPLYLQARGYSLRFFDPASLQTAVDLYHSAIDRDPTFAPAYAGLCEAVWEQYRDTKEVSQAQEAISACDTAADLAGSDPSVLVALGGVYVQTGQHRKAEATLRRVLQLDPRNAEAYRWLGRAHEALGQLEEAQGAYRAAISLRPDVWVYYDELASFFVYANRLDEARPLYEEVARLSPDNWMGYNGQAIIHLYSGDFAEAERFLRVSIEKQPNVVAYRNLGYIRLLERDYEGALEQLELGLALTDVDWYSWWWKAHAHHWRGDAALEEGSWRRVVELVTPLLGVNPGETQYLAALAEAYAVLGETDQSRSYLDDAAGLPVSFTFVLHFLGRAHEILGDREDALAYVERALEATYDRRFFEQDRWLDDLRADPRYGVLIERIGVGRRSAAAASEVRVRSTTTG